MPETPNSGAPPSMPVAQPVQLQLQMGHGDGPTLLDYILIVGALLLLGFGLWGLVMGHVSKDNLPTVASLLSFLAGTILGGYAGYRWGASATQKRLSGQAGVP